MKNDKGVWIKIKLEYVGKWKLNMIIKKETKYSLSHHLIVRGQGFLQKGCTSSARRAFWKTVEFSEGLRLKQGHSGLLANAKWNIGWK